MIWVLASVRKFGPALDILAQGTACGIPQAPDQGLNAFTLQLLSSSHSRFRNLNWRLGRQWKAPNSLLATCRGVRAAAWRAGVTTLASSTAGRAAADGVSATDDVAEVPRTTALRAKAEPVATMADLTDFGHSVLMGDKASLQWGTLGVLGLHP